VSAHVRTAPQPLSPHFGSRSGFAITHFARAVCESSLIRPDGVTDGAALRGLKFRKNIIKTETVVMRSVTGTVRRIVAEHRQFERFHLD
jgi:fructose-1,6-bisphosphatase II / sedoheptulose-1,7-bisphosphatase